MALSPIRFLRNLGRTREIVSVLVKYGFGDVVERMRLARYLRWWRRVILRRPETTPALSVAARIRLAFEELGPAFIKFGQVMSTRPDLIPAPLIAELEKLQERVPPFSGEEARRRLVAELGAPVERLFARFESEPLAAGSLGQVHRAWHFDGTALAVKIRRPGVVRDIERDLSLMTELAVLIERHMPEAEAFDPVGLVAQFARTIRREMEFDREGRTMDEIRRLFKNDATLAIPAVCENLTTPAVLTMEFMDGMNVTDHDGLLAAGLQPSEIAANGARIFFKLAFEHGVIYGDPHPGNLRIRADGVFGMIDFGMVGHIEDEKREQLVDLIASVTRGDVRACADKVLQIGRPFRPVDRTLLQVDVRDFVEGFYGLPLERIDVSRLLQEFVAILSGHGIRYPADLMLLIRAIITMDGVGRELDPQFELAAHLAPLVDRLLRERYDPQRMASRFFSDATTLLRVLHDLPIRFGETLTKLSRDDLRVHLEHRHLEHLITEVDRSSNRLVIGLVMSALIVASALVIRTAGDSTWWISVPTFILSSFLGIWLIYGVFRSGRL